MPDPIETEEVVAEVTVLDPNNNWAKHGALLVVDGSIPANNKRPVIVVETRTDGGLLDTKRVYPKGADVYFGNEADFGDNKPVVALGRDIAQGLTAGFSNHPHFINVGPASPVYAAANLAYIHGARVIEIIGLTDKQKAQLAPWFEEATRGGDTQSAHGGSHYIEPNSVKITLT